MLAILLGGIIVFLWIRGNRYRGQYKDQIEVNRQLDWDKSLAEAKSDSLKGIGEYSNIRVDTISRPYPVPGPARTEYDTVYLESGEMEPEPAIISRVEVDTSKWFGPEGERFGVRVYGLFHWPREFSYRNRLLIDPLGFEQPPTAPSEARSRFGWGVAPTIAWKSKDALYAGVSVNAGRVSIIGLSDFRKPAWIFGLGYRIF